MLFYINFTTQKNMRKKKKHLCFKLLHNQYAERTVVHIKLISSHVCFRVSLRMR